MSSKDPRRHRVQEPPCSAVHPDDAIDPRRYFRNDESRRSKDHKTRQLCAQVARALRFALQGLCSDPLLQRLDVQDVEPAPDARRLRVIVRPAVEDLAGGEVEARLAGAGALLRSTVAREIHRRRAPDLVFEVRPLEEEAS